MTAFVKTLHNKTTWLLYTMTLLIKMITIIIYNEICNCTPIIYLEATNINDNTLNDTQYMTVERVCGMVEAVHWGGLICSKSSSHN